VTSTPHPVEQFHQPRLRVAVDPQLVVVGEVAEQGIPRLADVERMPDKGIRIHIRFADLALPSLLTNQS
jgi:hypothetical protein